MDNSIRFTEEWFWSFCLVCFLFLFFASVARTSLYYYWAWELWTTSKSLCIWIQNKGQLSWIRTLDTGGIKTDSWLHDRKAISEYHRQNYLRTDIWIPNPNICSASKYLFSKYLIQQLLGLIWEEEFSDHFNSERKRGPSH